MDGVWSPLHLRHIFSFYIRCICAIFSNIMFQHVHRIDMEILLEPLKKYFHMYVYWAILVFSIVLGTLPPSFSVCIRGLNFYRKRVFIYSFFHCKKGVLGQAHVPVSPREYHVPLFLLLLKKIPFVYVICSLIPREKLAFTLNFSKIYWCSAYTIIRYTTANKYFKAILQSGKPILVSYFKTVLHNNNAELLLLKNNSFFFINRRLWHN